MLRLRFLLEDYNMNIETDSNEEETLEDKTIILDVEEKYVSTITGRILYIFYQLTTLLLLLIKRSAGFY